MSSRASASESILTVRRAGGAEEEAGQRPPQAPEGGKGTIQGAAKPCRTAMEGLPSVAEWTGGKE